MGETRGRLRSALHRLSSSDQMLEAEDLREVSDRFGGTPVDELPDRQLACVCGTLRSVTLRPRAGVPALVAELYDGSGTVDVVWLGRRQIAGIQAGSRIRVRGRIARRDGARVLFNPSYELLPGGSE
ncbi:OB-fold nucleic acid binding domain-containing protein [Angustibacter luteus]|uniref:OB-fold nucleic acid binding domain-containing protein n=1 Tax=Angustibacter luteus TaxID=658456 RepID=A0ABW1J9P4_9ACTN